MVLNRGSMGNSDRRSLVLNRGSMVLKRGSMRNDWRSMLLKRCSMSEDSGGRVSNSDRSSMVLKRSSMSEDRTGVSNSYRGSMVDSMRVMSSMSTDYLVRASKGGRASSSKTSKGSKDEGLHFCSIVS